MFKGRSAMRAGFFAACLALPAASAVAASTPATHKCFFITEWQGWSSPSPTVLYLKVNSDIYRVDLSVGSDLLRSPGMHLSSKLSDNASVCTPLDLDLEISDEMGALREPLIAKAITKLTPEEAAAIPPKLRP
ncbi:MAG: hypothetical protein M3T55_15040 [Pseudomonadota bacterium]|nr:hypothetical protein [Pseudomonadota bacterium]